jgi:hypothetical protein
MIPNKYTSIKKLKFEKKKKKKKKKIFKLCKLFLIFSNKMFLIRIFLLFVGNFT